MTLSRSQQAIFGLACFVLILDRLAKVVALRFLPAEGLKLLPWLRLELSLNPNIAFSLPLSGIPLYTILTIIIFILGYQCLRFFQQGQTWFGLLLSFILGGALSNICDRLFYGGVVDYLHIPHFTVFNLADSLICLSALSLCVLLLRPSKSS